MTFNKNSMGKPLDTLASTAKARHDPSAPPRGEQLDERTATINMSSIAQDDMTSLAPGQEMLPIG